MVRVTSLFCIGMAIVCAVILVVQFAIGTNDITFWATVFGFCATVAMPLPLWLGLPLRWWVVVVTAAVSVQTAFATFLCADPGSILSWLAAPVLMARVLGGRRAAWVSMGIAVGTCLIYSASLYLDIAPPPVRERVVPQEQALYVLVLVVCIYGLGEVAARGYERAMNQATKSTSQLQAEVEEHRTTRTALEQAHLEVIQTARVAGMAEVATGVLHNVGNALNTVNVTAHVVRESVAGASLESRLERLAERVADPATDRELVARYIRAMARQARTDTTRITGDMDRLTGAVAHVASVVSAQQAHARNRGVVQTFSVADVFDEVLRLARPVLTANRVEVSRTGALDATLNTERHQVVQILENLVRNGAEALANTSGERHITLTAASRDESVLLVVHDSGPGVPEEDQQRIFQHGFTRKATGSGFGLHVSALAAQSLGGRLDLTPAEGGACFTLAIPASEPQVLRSIHGLVNDRRAGRAG